MIIFAVAPASASRRRTDQLPFERLEQVLVNPTLRYYFRLQ